MRPGTCAGQACILALLRVPRRSPAAPWQRTTARRARAPAFQPCARARGARPRKRAPWCPSAPRTRRGARVEGVGRVQFQVRGRVGQDMTGGPRARAGGGHGPRAAEPHGVQLHRRAGRARAGRLPRARQRHGPRRRRARPLSAPAPCPTRALAPHRRTHLCCPSHTRRLAAGVSARCAHPKGAAFAQTQASAHVPVLRQG